MIGTELTAVSTFGWFTDTEEFDQDLLTSVSTFGWYGMTLRDLIDIYPTRNFGLVICQLKSAGLEIEQLHEIEDLEIHTLEELGNFEITRLLNIELKR